MTVGNVSTLSLGGLFKGAVVGTQAYADYVNSTGGVNGRKIMVNSADDNFTGATNKQATQNAIENDFAAGRQLLPRGQLRRRRCWPPTPGCPTSPWCSTPTTNSLPNVYSAVPLNGGWQEGPLQYFKQKFPNDVTAVGAMIADLPSAQTDWAGEKYVMQKVGYHIAYEANYGIAQTDFTSNVIAMKNAGVKILFVDSMAETYASALLKNLVEQNFHPVVVLGAADLHATSWCRTRVARRRSTAPTSNRTPRSTWARTPPPIPAVGTFLHWVEHGVARVHP